MNSPTWADISLADCVVSVGAGVSVNSEDRPHVAGEVGVLKTSAVSGGVFKAYEHKTVISKDRPRVAEPVLGGSVLFSRMNTPLLVGESCYVESDHPSLFLPDRLWQIRVEPCLLDARWLSYILQSAAVSSAVRALATGTSASMKNIAKHSLLALKIPLPALAEQRWMAEALGALDERASSLTRIIAKLEQCRTGVINDALSGQDFDHTVSLGSLAEVGAGVTLGSEPSGPGTVSRPYLRVANVQDGHLDLGEIKRVRVRRSDLKRFELQPGDVLMNEGGDADKLGRGAVWEEQIPGCLHQNHVFRVRCQSGALSPRYLSLITGSAIGKRYFLAASKQTTNLATINSKRIEQYSCTTATIVAPA